YSREEINLDVTPHDGEVAFVLIKLRDAGKQPPFFKTELLEQFQARCVVGKDEADHCSNLKRWRARDRFLKKRPGNTAPTKFFIDVNADLVRAAIRAAWQKRFQRQPAGNFTTDLQDPEWMSIRRMIFQPMAP